MGLSQRFNFMYEIQKVVTFEFRQWSQSDKELVTMPTNSYGGTDGSLATVQFHVRIKKVVTFEYRQWSQSDTKLVNEPNGDEFLRWHRWVSLNGSISCTKFKKWSYSNSDSVHNQIRNQSHPFKSNGK